MPNPFSGTALRLFLFTVLGVVISLFIGAAVIGVLVGMDGLTVSDSSAVYETIEERQQLRLLLLVNNLITFGLAALIGLVLTYRGRWAEAAGLVSPPRKKLVTLSVVTFVVALPLIALTAYLNLQLDLPEWMVQSEDTGNAMMAGVLTFENFSELLLSLVTVAVVPAVSEELLFRGVLQKRILGDFMGGHLAVWVAAFIFSAIHVEFAGFLPRLFLGALLGYTYRWTGSLWVPIILHFFFNGTQVVTTYLSGEFTPDTEMDMELVPLMIMGVISFVLTIYFTRRNERMLDQSSVYAEEEVV